jgi:acyl transferase domain-containing protein/NADPH:quinone reductase-like Zn-dependent oxidoreductase/NADP-dependent 3-hydroxy acid dehydrogenase YdfG/acyl carrier protein
VGSVKTNLGHLEGACALPGILKVVAAIEQGEIPPTLGFQTPNPRIDFQTAKARVTTSVELWPKNKLKRASVTSAGFGGTNGHCVIDHVHNVLPSYLKPGILGQRVQEMTGTNGDSHVNGTNGVSNGYANGTGGHSNAAHGDTGINGTNGTNGTNGIPALSNHHSPVINMPAMVRKADAATRKLVVLPFSAHHRTSLEGNIDVLSQDLRHHSLADLAYTLAAKRSRFTQRAYCIVDKDSVAETGLRQETDIQIFSSPQHVSAGFIFTGQGAQWHAMGEGLFEYAVFRDSISYLDTILSMLPERVTWKLPNILRGNCEKDLIQTPAVSQSVCTAVQIGLVDLLASWGVRPSGVAGHSSGEMAAAYASGRITAAEAITVAYYRGYVVSLNKHKGAMLAVGFGTERAVEYIRQAGLEGQVRVAAINSFDSVTISGDAEPVEELSAKLTREAVFNRLVRTSGLAYHSHHMLPLGSEYEEKVNAGMRRLKELGVDTENAKYPVVPWVSSVTPEKSTTQVSASYWRANLESPVRFTDAVSKLLDVPDLNIGALIEIGPHPALKSPLGQIVKSLGKSIPHVPSLKRNEDAQRSMLDCIGTLFALNVDVNLVAVNAVDGQLLDGQRQLEHGCTGIDLPPYKYTYGPIKYHESRLSKEYRLRSTPRHDLLGSKVPGTTKLRPQWRNMLRLKDLPWLDDHRVPPHVLHPGAAHIVMAMVAAEHAYKEFPDALPIYGLTMRNVSIKKTLVVPEDDYGIEIVLGMELEDGATAKSPGWTRFSIASVVRDANQWTEHCSGQIKVEVAPFEQAPPIDTTMDGRAVDAQTWYTRFADMGLQFGPSFQGYSDIRADPAKNIASAKLALNTTAGMFPGGESPYPIHPASLDLVIRLGLMACNGGQAETASVQLPIHFGQMRFNRGRLEGRKWATGISRGELRGLRGAYAQLQMLDEEGNVMLDVDNMRFTSLNNEQDSSATGDSASKPYWSPFARLVWRPDLRTLSKNQLNEALVSIPGRAGQFSQLCNIFDLAGHANPDLRILEVNASSDAGAHRAVLQTLVGANCIKRYSEFVVADVSQEQLTFVRESTSDFRDVSYSILDLNRNPSEQGFQLGFYDIVLWSSPVHSSEAWEHLRSLIRPGGHLVQIGTTVKASDCRGLESAGFKLIGDIVGPDYQSTVTLHVLSAPQQLEHLHNKVVHFLHGANGAPSLLHQLARAIEQHGVTSQTSLLDDVQNVLSPNSHVVVFLDGENLLFGADQHRLGLFQHLAANTASMLWLTSCGLVKGRNPDGSFVSGLLRTLGSENPAGDFLSIDIDAEGFKVKESELDELLRSLVDQELSLQAKTLNGGESPVNRDLVWQDGCMWVSRIVPDADLLGYDETTVDDRDIKLMPLGNVTPIRAAFKTPGVLTSLYFRPYTELLQPLPRDWIEVRVQAVGLNWKDLGLCSGRFDQNNLSNEYVGVVSSVGSAVTNVKVGDRVYGMGKGHFGNYTRVPAALAQQLPNGLDAMEAATMPLVYMTAVYAFEHITRVKEGSKVLIQSGSGGLGLAAIQLARSKGADVYVTAGTPEKTRFLIDSMSIAPDHIYSSRRLADLPRMATATLNGGFDVILSSSQGDMLYESIKALAPLGHLVDVGRLDVTNSRSVSLELFQKSASFTSFDLGLVIERNVELGGELMAAVSEHFRAGHISPIRPYHASDISQLDQALLKFSKGTHIGKMIISYQNPQSMLRTHQSVPRAHFDQEARYILVGGLSSLGRSIIRWMASRGARDLVIWSRRGLNNMASEAESLIEEMAAQGVRVQPVACDVSNREQVLRGVQEANSQGTLRGVFNFAVSYQDISFDKMTEEKFHKGMAAKVFGTKHLHEATANLPLDFFVMTSSLGTVYAFPTQSTYLGANNFLDYFARYRRRCGLPATTVSLGFINDLGALTQDAVTVNLFVRAKGQTVTGSQVLRALEPAFVSNPNTEHHYLGHGQDPLSAANIVTGIDPAVLVNMKRAEDKTSTSGAVPRWYHDPRVSLMLRALDDGWRHRNVDGSDKGVASSNGADESPTVQLRRQFDTSIRKLGSDQDKGEVMKTVALVTEAIRAMVAGMLFIDPSAVKAAKTVVDHGIDSLLAAEFRSWLNGAFGKNMSMLDLMDARTSIDAMAQAIVQEAIAA